MIQSLFLSIFFFSQPDAHAGNRGSPAEEMISFFGSTCIAQDGSYTKTALNKALVLAETLEGIKDDPDCKDLSAAASQAGSITSALNVLETKIYNNQNYSNQEYAILSSMAMSSDPEVTTSLQDLLVKVGVNKKLSNYDEQAIAAREMIVQTNSLVQQAINNQKCLLKRPNVLSTIGSVVSSVGVAATAINPAIGLGATVGGNMLSTLVNLINQAKLAKQIRKIKNDILMPEALSCVMESLSNDYCRAEDAIAAIDWKSRHKVIKQFPITSPAYAMNLVDREIPTLVRWLTTLRTAAKSQNIYDASQVNDFKSREALYEASPSLASGVLESANINQSDSSDVKWSALRRTVRMLVGILADTDQRFGNSSSRNPLFQVYSQEQALYYLIGFSPSKIPSNQQGPINFENYNPNSAGAAQPDGGISYDLNVLTQRFNDWFTLTRSQVDAERNRVMKQDPQVILQSAFKGEQNQEHISPYNALTNIILFLTAQQTANPTDSESLYLLPDTISRLKLIQDKLDGTHSEFWQYCTKDDSSEFLGEIYKFAELGNGVAFINDRLKYHADSALILYLTKTPTPADQSVLAQTLASDKMTDVLLKTNPGKDYGAIREDILNSEGITLNTFDGFINNYQQNIRDVLEDLMANEKRYGTKAGKTYHAKRSRICLLLTQAVQWPWAVPFEYCAGTSYNTIEGGPQSAPLTEAVIKKEFQERSCKLYQLRRDTLIFNTRAIFQ